MKNHQTGTPMSMADKCVAWLQLTRFDKPVGTELLLYPTLWAVLLASVGIDQKPAVKLIIIFALGAVLMRAAGCAINDFADRKVDGQVKRTHGRPLADGRLSARTAVMSFVGLSLLAACLLLFLPLSVFYWSLVAVSLAFVYPFMKRFTNLPQVVLAAAFGWAIPMAYVAVQGHTDTWTWVLFAAYMCWTVAYDTEYAMCDRDDDLKIGVKSTAILFACYDVAIIMLLNALFVLLIQLAFWHYFSPKIANWLIVVGFCPVLVMFWRQYQLIKNRERLACFTAFRQNAWVGRYVFGLTVLFVLMVQF
ncbi:4-hydroxybenzoate octaprenyltransferase [Moraxella sp. ZJ142]|uniref:4-hydroxybenzoate octaprenyltransferase n=1 Tax=Moraxella marmotae TaxID=3344520 RepID=UPI0035D409A9